MAKKITAISVYTKDGGWSTSYPIGSTVKEASATIAGILKAYTSTGSNTDGTMTQAAITQAIDNAKTTINTASPTVAGVTKVYTSTGSNTDGTMTQAAITQAIDNAKTTINAEQWDKIYPIGSIYISANSTSPAELFGGTWEQIKDRFLLAAGNTYAAGSTGGEAEHTLTVDEMPAHSHLTGIQSNAGGYIDGNSNAVVHFDPDGRATSNTGGNQPHNNMPPYLAVYIWYRVA